MLLRLSRVVMRVITGWPAGVTVKPGVEVLVEAEEGDGEVVWRVVLVVLRLRRCRTEVGS